MINDFAYIAGYVDGDGCLYMGTTVQKPKNILIFEYSLQIVSVEKNIFDFFLKHGGFVRTKKQLPKHKIPYIYMNKSCLKIIQSIMPYLKDKFKEAFYMINYIKSIKSTKFQKVDKKTLNYRKNLIISSRGEKMSNFVTKDLIDSIKNTKPSIVPTVEDYAYLAGFIEAEGTFRIKSWKPKNRPNKVYNTSLEIGNTRYPVFPWLMDRFGGNISFYKPKKTKRAVAIWSIQSDSLKQILDNIYPFLRTRKKIVCEKIMEFQRTVLPNGGDRHSEEFKQRINAIIAKREALINEIHILNKKGC